MGKRILIFSASIGSGHDSAAAALREYYQSEQDDCDISIMDCFGLVNPSFSRLVSSGYFKTLYYSPSLWGRLYGQTDHVRRHRWLSALATLFFDRFDDLILNSKPDIVLTTHPFAAAVLSALKQRRGRRFCLSCVLTDFGVHSLWLYPGTDMYFVPTAAAYDECLRYGISEDRLCCSGIPVKAAFAAQYDRGALRAQLGLDNRPVLLLTGGGAGLGRLREAAEMLLDAPESYQIVAVTGNNEALYERLRELSVGHDALRVLSYVDNVAEWMAAADLVIGKCGGLTTAEAAAIGVPMLILDPLPGHERRNAEYIRSLGAAAEVEDLSALLTAVSELLTPEKQRAMRLAMKRLGRGDAAQTICTRLDQWLAAPVNH